MVYESYMDGDVGVPLFVTKSGNKPVGALFQVGRGHLVILPPIEYDDEEFTTRDKDGTEVWSKDAVDLGRRFISALIEIDKALRSEVERSSTPQWVGGPQYVIKTERELMKKIAKMTKQIDELDGSRQKLAGELHKEAQLKDLLFESGKPLEEAVLTALRILGYQAEGETDGDIELDAVISSPEGDRFIGETEGKDRAAISVEKFRQLESNIQEDLRGGPRKSDRLAKVAPDLGMEEMERCENDGRSRLSSRRGWLWKPWSGTRPWRSWPPSTTFIRT
jgi:hypothetical protein